MKRIFEKHETAFCMLFIAVYVVVNSVCVQNFGYTSVVGFSVNAVLSVCLFAIVLLFKKSAYYGFTNVQNPKKFLYFIPLAVIVSVNLWGGINLRHPTSEIVFHILTMIHIGFLEELIFRGFLFRMMAKTNVTAAILVSSLTFGVGHIVNLWGGADLLPTLLQIGYAASIGYLFALIVHKGHSLIPCILAHATMNALSVFQTDNTVMGYITSVFLIIAPLVYACYIHKQHKD